MHSLILKKKKRREKKKSGWRCVEELGWRSLAQEAADVRLPVNWNRQGKFGTSTDIFFHCNLR